MIEWRDRAQGLAAALVAAGALSDRRWVRAMGEVPRHVFVPEFFEQTINSPAWQTVSGDDPVTREYWMDAVYSDRALATMLSPDPDLDGWQVPVSSSTLPSQMTRMLETLAVDDGHDVVEVGTGTGYNAGLLCARLGDRQVHSVDVEPAVVDAARRRLASLGWRPRLTAVDAANWSPPPFDRLIATCSVETITPTWLTAARPGAVLVVPLTGPLADGSLVRLTADGQGAAHGRFAYYAGFMPLRSGVTEPSDRPMPRVPDKDRGARHSEVDPAVLTADHPVAMLVQRHLPGARPLRRAMTEQGTTVTILIDRDGSWARAEHTPTGSTVHVNGPTDVWGPVQDTYRWWVDHGCPGWERFGLSVTSNTHVLWLDRPEHVLLDRDGQP